MKKAATILCVLLGLTFLNAYGQSDTTNVKQPEEAITLQIKGMACEFCARNLKRSLSKLEGISIHEIDPQEGFAKLSFTPGSAPSNETLKKSVKNASFVLEKIVTVDRKESHPRKQDR